MLTMVGRRRKHGLSWHRTSSEIHSQLLRTVSDLKHVPLPRCNLGQQPLKVLEGIQKNLAGSVAVALKAAAVLGAGCLGSCLKRLANGV